MNQAASDAGNVAGLVYFIFDLLHRDGEDVAALPLIERKARLADLLSGAGPPLQLQATYHPRPGRGPPRTGLQARASRASSRNAPMRPTHPAIAASGSRP